MSSTAQDQSSADLEEIFNLDPAVLEQLLQEEEPPQHNLVDVDSQTIAHQSWDVARELFRIREGRILRPRPYERPKRKDKTMDRKEEERLRLFDLYQIKTLELLFLNMIMRLWKL